MVVTRPLLLMVVAADRDGAVGVMQDVVTDAAQNRSSNEAEAASANHDHRGVFGGRQVHNRLSGTRSELDDNSSAHLYNVDAPVWSTSFTRTTEIY